MNLPASFPLDGIIKALIVLGLLFIAGRIMYQGRGKRYRFRMLHVVVNFVLIMAVNAVIMGLLIAIAVALEIAAGMFAPELAVPFFTPSGKLAGDNLLVFLFAIIFLTAFVHYGLRAFLRSISKLFVLEDDEISIFEYFIQWTTIYFVVYQCIFEGFASYFAWAGAGADGIQDIFEILLKPENINLVVQPLLISSWILVVLERFARQNKAKRSDIAEETGVAGA